MTMNKHYAFSGKTLDLSRLILLAGTALWAMRSQAQLNVAAVNTPYTIDFDATVAGVNSGAWAGGGFQSVPIVGRLDSDGWAITGWSDGDLAYGGTRITSGTDYRRGTTAPGNGAVAVGGMYSFGGAGITGRALGFQPGASDWAPGNITLRIQNTTGSTLTAFDISYNLYYRDDQPRSTLFNLRYSDDSVTYHDVSALDLTSPVGPGGAGWVANPRSTTVSGVYIPNGKYFYVRWRSADVSGTGTARDEFALDDITITGRAYTQVRLTASSATVSESGGTTLITASIVNPHPTNSTTVDLALTSGPSARINGYTTQTITFPGGSLANQSKTITITDNGACDGDATEVFTLQNVMGGVGTPNIGSVNTITLTVDDDETAPVTYAQAFDGGVGDNWSITAGAGNVSGSTGAGDTPANQRVLSTANSWQVNNASATLDLATVDVTDWTSTTLTARVSSTSVTGTDGADGSDSVAFYINLNGAGFPVDPDIRIGGVSNARWGYSTGTGVASTTAGTPMNFQPAGGGNRTTDGYSYVQITIPNGSTSVALRVVAKNNTSNEVWNVENIQMTGTLCSPVYYSRSNGSEVTATWSTSRTGSPAPSAVTFNKNATMVVQNTHTVTTTSNTSLAVHNLSVETGGSLSLAGVSTVQVNGPTFNVAGTLTSSDDNVDLVSSELTTISGASTIDVNNMTLNGFGALVTVGTLKVRGTLQLDKGDFNANNKEVQLLSTASGTARLGPVAAIASYTSKLRLERYIPAGVTDWRLLCSPVQGKTVADWTDDFFTAGFPGSAYPNFYDPPGSGIFWPSVRKYDETNPGPLDTDGLIGVSSVSDALTVGKGFAAWSGSSLNTTTAFTIDVRGVPQVANTPFSIPLTYTNTGVPAVDGLNLVGNPLPSPIDFGALTLTNVDNNYYIYDPGSGTNAAWDETMQVGTGGANGNIQSSQGFWLHANAASPSATLTESAKVLEPINGGIFSEQDGPRPMVRLLLHRRGTEYNDEALVHFIGGEPGDGPSDMMKMTFGSPRAAFISTRSTSGRDLVINAYGPMTDDMAIPVAVRVPQSGQYSITMADVADALGLGCLSLEDLRTGIVTPVSEGASYSFTIEAGARVDPPRFVLHVTSTVQAAAVDALCAGEHSGRLVVHGPGNANVSYELSDAHGSVAHFNGTGAQGHTFSDLAAGEYHLRVSGGGCGEMESMVVVHGPAPISARVSARMATCGAATDGAVEVEPAGGTAPYTITWNNGEHGRRFAEAGAGRYSARIADAHGCSMTTDEVVVGAAAAPVAAFSTGQDLVMPGEGMQFFNDGTYGLTYAWNFGDGATSDENEPVHVYTAPGTYTVTLTAGNGDCTASIAHQVTIGLATGNAQHAANEATTAWTEGAQIVVQWQVAGASGITADVIDATGRMVVQRSAKGSLGRLNIPSADMPAGVYFVRLRSGELERTVKLSVQH